MFEYLGVADWVVWYMVANYIGLACVATYIIYRKRFKLGYMAKFLRKEVSGWVVVGSKEFKSTDKLIKFRKKKGFKVDLKKLSYRDRGWQYLYYDFDKGALLNFDVDGEGVPPEDVDLFLGSGIVERIVMGFKGIATFTLIVVLILIVVAGMAYLIGLLSAQYVLPALEEMFGNGEAVLFAW